MKAKLRKVFGDKFSIAVDFPIKPTGLYDILDRLNAEENHDNLYINIEDKRIPLAMREGGFYGDIFKLNLLAEKLNGLSEAETAGFTAVLLEHKDYNLDDLILAAYGADSFPIIPCQSLAELGEFAIDMDFIPEVRDCPEEYLKLLDREKIGELIMEKRCGRIVDGYYCEVSDYEQPDIKFTFQKQERPTFQILLGENKMAAQWYTLPCDEDLSDLNIYDLISPLPSITTVENIESLNDVAKKVSALDHKEFIKLKAIMESYSLKNVGDVLFALKNIDRFEFDNSVRTAEEYGRKYLSKMLPHNFETELLSANYLRSFGVRVLDRKGGAVTSYGVLSGIDQQLYTAILQKPEQSETDDETESENEELGACLT